MASPADVFHDPDKPVRLTPEQRQKADELAHGALKAAREGRDVEAYLRDWAEDMIGRKLPGLPEG